MSAPVYVHPCTSFADIVVDNKIILELKAVNAFSPAMEAQLLNYLSISGIKVVIPPANASGATFKVRLYGLTSSVQLQGCSSKMAAHGAVIGHKQIKLPRFRSPG